MRGMCIGASRQLPIMFIARDDQSPEFIYIQIVL